MARSKVKILCPYCFKEFKREEVQIQCKNEQTVTRVVDGKTIIQLECPPEEDEKYNNYWGVHTKIKHIFDANLTREELGGLFRNPQPIHDKTCKCGKTSNYFVCPHCHNRLPPEMIERGSEIISVIGGPASGKSNYIVSLIHELRKYGNRLGLSVTLQNVGRSEKERTTTKYEEAKKTVFEDHMALAKTPPVPHPIPWIMRLESHSTKKAVYVVFYDTAGESFNDPDRIARDADYLRYSKAVIVAFDTLGVPKIKRILEKNKTEISDQISKYEKMWNTIRDFEENNPRLKMTSRPFAFVFTKFDTVIDNARDLDFNLDAFVDDDFKFTNSSFVRTGKVNMSELNNCNMAIKDALNGPWHSEVAIAQEVEEKWNNNGMFFGISALGGMKDSLNIRTVTVDNVEEVVPVKVLDPLVWILVKLGGFDIPTE